MAVPNSLILWGNRVTATAPTIQVTANSVSSQLTWSDTLSLTTDYYMSGDADGATDLMEMLENTLETHTQITTATCNFDANFDLTITTSPHSSILEWSHANTDRFLSLLFGFHDDLDTTPSDTSDSASHTSTYNPQGIWRPQQAVSIDSRPRQPVVGGVSESISGLARVSRIATPEKMRDLAWFNLNQARVLTEYATDPFESFEYAWINSISKGYAFRYYSDETSITTPASHYRVVDLSDPMARSDAFVLLWDVNLGARAVSSLDV